MIPPMISYVTWNRMGLTARNLSALLSTDEDFELHIVDNNSQDDTWKYIENLCDNRIKQKFRFDSNRGHVFATNYNLTKRKKDQYFITIDNDVNIHSKNWISEFIKVFDAFPEVGLLGSVNDEYYRNYRLTHIRKEKNGVYYLQVCKGYVEGCCQCIRPEVFDYLGYWNEELCIGDVEICYRICNFTPYKVGFIPSIKIDQAQYLSCLQCSGKEFCYLNKEVKTCFSIQEEKYKHPALRNLYSSRYQEFTKKARDGKLKMYCPSIHDLQSMFRENYDKEKADSNFKIYMQL